MENKKAQSHVEMMLSFVIFVGALMFIFIFLNPFAKTADKVSVIDDIQRVLIEDIGSEVGKMSVIVNDYSLDCYSLTKSQVEELTILSEELMTDYEQNSSRIARSSGGNSYIVQYNPILSKPIIDMIDKIFSNHYDFNSA